MGSFLHNLLGGGTSGGGPPYTHTFVPPEPVGVDEDGNDVYPPPGPSHTLTGPARILTSSDPEPPAGTVVRDCWGRTWELAWEDEGGMWWRTDADDDPESWTKVAGNYGPVTVLEEGGDDDN